MVEKNKVFFGFLRHKTCQRIQYLHGFSNPWKIIEIQSHACLCNKNIDFFMFDIGVL
jgi:hypothetical protein